MEIDLKQLRELMRSLKQFDVHEIEIEKDGERIYLRRGSEGASVVAPAAAAAPGLASVAPPSAAPAPDAATSGSAPKAGAAAADDPHIVVITSPFVGTFYRAPSPDAPPFVEVGSEIRPGQVLCIVEAMKLMNEIEAEVAGVVIEVLAENGKPVEYGDALFKVRKTG
jgi:acetyl-CoA carboxylase biotin carboxyl carrier protein